MSFKKLLNIFIFNVFSHGAVDSKIKTQNKFDYTLAIEPFLGYPVTILEKIFDPMSGSIPIYFGPKKIPIPDNCYIRISDEISVEGIINLVNKTTYKEKSIQTKYI